MQTLKKIARLLVEAFNPPPSSPNIRDHDTRQAWELIALWNLHPGDEHPTKKGWILQKKIGPNGEPMWFREYPAWRRSLRTVVISFVMGFLTGAVVAGFNYYG